MAEIQKEPERQDASVVRLDERRLLTLHRRGDANAFAELLNRYRAPVYGYLVRCKVPAAARDDLFQEIFLKVHAAAATYQADRPLKPWLFTIVANTVRTFYRKKKVQELVFAASDVEAKDDRPKPESVAQGRETAAWLGDAIGELPFAQREVVVLSAIEGMSTQEVATVLDLPTGTVKTNLRRARLSLTRALARRNARLEREVSP